MDIWLVTEHDRMGYQVVVRACRTVDGAKNVAELDHYDRVDGVFEWDDTDPDHLSAVVDERVYAVKRMEVME